MNSTSVWYDMGMRDSQFCGVNPCTFLNTAYRFFFELKTACRRSIVPGYSPSDSDKYFSITGKAIYQEYLAWNRGVGQNRFSYGNAPYGTPFPREKWDAPRPSWEDDTLSPKLADVLLEEPFSFPNQYAGQYFSSKTLDFSKQLYSLIQKMRFCIIPIECFHRDAGYLEWHEYWGNSGCVNNTISWRGKRRLKFQIPEYWRKEQTQCKIGVCARNITPEFKVPIDGSFWKGTEYTTPESADDVIGESEMRVYGVIDLSTHPDFRKYIDSYSQQ